MPQDHQQEDLQPSSWFTYFLRAGKCHKTISKTTCGNQTGSLTVWEQENATRPSARGPAAIKQVHLLSESRKMSQDHQQEGLQPSNWFTYILRAGKCHKTISKRTCSHQTGSLTSWEQANATKPSARRSAAIKLVHLHTESRKMPQDHQQEDLQPSNRFTYILRAGKCHKIISKRTCSHQTGALTVWEQENTTRPSARGPAAIKLVHLLSESRKMPQDHQQEDLQPSNRFTYILRADKCHKTISKTTCSHQTDSPTPWEQANATWPWARGPAAIKQVHLQAESRQMPHDHQEEDPQPSNRFTYLLSRQMPQDHQQEDLQPSNRLTYILRAGKCHKTISRRTCGHKTGSLTYWEQANATDHQQEDLQPIKQVHLLPESRQMWQDH